MSPFNSWFLTQNYHSKYVERLSGKTHLSVSYQWCHVMFLKWKYTARQKIGVKVDWFLKTVWKTNKTMNIKTPNHNGYMQLKRPYINQSLHVKIIKQYNHSTKHQMASLVWAASDYSYNIQAPLEYVQSQKQPKQGWSAFW